MNDWRTTGDDMRYRGFLRRTLILKVSHVLWASLGGGFLLLLFFLPDFLHTIRERLGRAPDTQKGRKRAFSICVFFFLSFLSFFLDWGFGG